MMHISCISTPLWCEILMQATHQMSAIDGATEEWVFPHCLSANQKEQSKWENLYTNDERFLGKTSSDMTDQLLNHRCWPRKLIFPKPLRRSSRPKKKRRRNALQLECASLLCGLSGEWLVKKRSQNSLSSIYCPKFQARNGTLSVQNSPKLSPAVSLDVFCDPAVSKQVHSTQVKNETKLWFDSSKASGV